MALVVDPGLLDYMASNSGSCTFVLKDMPPEAAVRGCGPPAGLSAPSPIRRSLATPCRRTCRCPSRRRRGPLHDRLGTIRIRDAGTARNVEIQLTTDPAKVAEAQAAVLTWEFPLGVEIRLDRR